MAIADTKVVKYFIEAKEEMQKVTWPSQREVVRYTLTVIVATVLLSLFFTLVDFGASQGLRGLINTFNASTFTQESTPLNIEDIIVNGEGTSTIVEADTTSDEAVVDGDVVVDETATDTEETEN